MPPLRPEGQEFEERTQFDYMERSPRIQVQNSVTVLVRVRKRAQREGERGTTIEVDEEVRRKLRVVGQASFCVSGRFA